MVNFNDDWKIETLDFEISNEIRKVAAKKIRESGRKLSSFGDKIALFNLYLLFIYFLARIHKRWKFQIIII